MKLNFLEEVFQEEPANTFEVYERRIRRALLNMKISGETRKTRFFYKILSQGLFGASPHDREYNKENAILIANKIDRMISILNNKMEEDWDFYVAPVFNGTAEEPEISLFNVHLVLRYPYQTVKNSSGYEWNIQNLFLTFKISINDGTLVINSPEGTRGTLHVEEIYYPYYHSHLRTPFSEGIFSYIDAFKTCDMCLGESDTQDLIERLASPVEDFNEDVFEAFLYSLDTLVSWESLEGVPYRYIADIRPIIGGNGYENYTISRNYIRDQSEFLDSMGDEISTNEEIKNLFKELDFRVQGDRIIISNNKKLENLILKAYANKDNDNEIKKNVLYFTLPNSPTYYSTEGLKYTSNIENIIENYLANVIDPATGETPYYFFRNKKIPLVVYHDYDLDSDEEEMDVNLKVHPAAIYKLKEYYEKILFNKTVENYIPINTP